ncbi:MAG: NAD-dependent succinate-semialdehyde dehydrogenase [Gammaproteobacteria bacterium]|nr:NAD-dependent succinate-semialdehyde dehydrogenase [Gammaproteobacteria bacterium]
MALQLEDPTLFKTEAFINGQWVNGSDTFDVYNPATGEVIASVASVGAEETRQAIECAQIAQRAWRARTARERSVILRRWYDLILANVDDLAIIMTSEQGKPLAEARAEIANGASFIEWFAEECKRTYGDVIPTMAADRRLLTIKQPVGVVGAITPWNFPHSMLARKVAPALASGCAFVAKPARETPLSALALAELGARAGIPAGVLNVLVGKSASAIGNELTRNPIVRKITFTGSTPIGKLLLEQSASTVKKVSMELGGNAPVIVFDDAYLDKAVAGAIASKYRNAGQTCICANRILVQENVYDEFADKFAAAVGKFTLGNGMDDGVTMGPLINTDAIADVDSMVQDALENGATALTGGQPSALGDSFYEPTVLINVADTMRVFREEIFGPVAPLFKFKDEAEAIAMANDTEFGLVSYIYTRDIGRVWRVSEGVEYGMVGVNEVAIIGAEIPFGGVKQSGMGREGSKYGMDDYMEIKYICMGDLHS